MSRPGPFILATGVLAAAFAGAPALSADEVAKPAVKVASKPAASKGSKGDPAKGKKTYETYCVTCHGMGGKGDGPSAAGLTVKPRDHTDDSKMGKLSDDQVFKTVKEGGKAMGKSELMPPWGGALKDPEIRDVVAYVRTLHRKPKS